MLPLDIRLIRYFSECLQKDNEAQSIWDIFREEYQYLHIIDGNFSSKISLSVKNESIKHLLSTPGRQITQEINSSFLCAAYFYIGDIPFESSGTESQPICAPLVYYETKIVENHFEKDTSSQHLTLEINPHHFSLNKSLLNCICSHPDRVDIINCSFLKEPFDREFGRHFADFLLNLGTKANIDTIDCLPNLFDARSVKELVGQSKNSKTKFEAVIAPAAATLLASTPIHSENIVSELDTICQNGELSIPLAQILLQEEVVTEQEQYHDPESFDNSALPALLSKSQLSAIRNSTNKSLSLLTGPPGTGKTYTLSSIALNNFLNKKSVLIVSSNDTALDAIQKMLSKTFEISQEAIVRTGDAFHHKPLEYNLENLLDQPLTNDADPNFDSVETLREHNRFINNLEKRFRKNCQQAIRDGKFFYKYNNSSKIKKRLYSILNWIHRRRVRHSVLLYSELATIQESHALRNRLKSSYINTFLRNRFATVLKYGRVALSNFLHLLNCHSAGLKQDNSINLDYNTILDTFPIWITPLDTLHQTLPLKPNLFDLVIFDESNQCNIAKSLPALYRAKRAVIIGDKHQLRIRNLLSAENDLSISKNHQLTATDIGIYYHSNSLLDYAEKAATSVSATTNLSEQYRCHPNIIAYANKHFYHNKLRIMTEKPISETDASFEIITCKGKNKNNINRPEADSLLMRLGQIIEYQSRLPGVDRQSIGIISFFSEHLSYLEKQVLSRFDLKVLKTFDIKIGLPETFQGQERDTILVSCVIDQNTPEPIFFHYLDNLDKFNVAITRARARQIVFLSRPISSLPRKSLLHKYLSEMQSNPLQEETTTSSREQEVGKIVSWLRSQGYSVFPNFTFSGIRMDMAIVYNGTTIVIDLIGFPGEIHDTLHLDQYRIFERAGLAIFPLSYGTWIYNKDDLVSLFTAMVEISSDRTIAMFSETEGLQSYDVAESAASQYMSITQLEQFKNLKSSLIQLDDDLTLEHLDSIKRKFIHVVRALGNKLNSRDFTYINYKQIIDKVITSTFSNLETVVYIKKNIGELYFQSNDAKPLKVSNSDTYISRNDLESDFSTKQIQRIDKLISENNQAMDVLDKAAIKFAFLNKNSEQSSSNIDKILSEIVITNDSPEMEREDELGDY